MAGRRPRIAIVGAGVAGAIVAGGLRELGDRVDVVCLERVARGDHAGAGTGLNVGPNALKALERHLPALARCLYAESQPWRSWRISLTDGRLLMDLPLGEVADNDGIRIRWSELYRLLREAAGPAIRYGIEVDEMRYAGPGEAGPLVLRYTDIATGREEVVDGIDLLIAGDGRYSQVRSAFFGPAEPTFLGIAIFRMLIEKAADTPIDDYEQWFNGPNRLLAFQVPGGAVYLAGAFPIPPGDETPPEDRQPSSLRARFLPASGQPDAKCRFLIDALAADGARLHWARFQQSPAAYRDRPGHVLLLGDASHAMVPTLGQGATQAVEDACAAVALIRASVTADAFAAADMTARYVACREARIRFVVDFSVAATDTMLAGADPVAGAARKSGPAFRRDLERLYRDTPEI
ncbi:MAG: FAD-dependent monooxygenase [Alphaproteobacteria bacterium]